MQVHNSTLRVPSLPPPIIVCCCLHSRQSHHHYLNLNELLTGRASTLCIFGPLPNLGCVYCWKGRGKGGGGLIFRRSMYYLILQKLKLWWSEHHRHRHTCMYHVGWNWWVFISNRQIKNSPKFPAIWFVATREKVNEYGLGDRLSH